MGPMMMSHVYKLTGTLHPLERSLHNSLRTAHESDHGTVRGLSRINIQHFDSS